MKITGKMNFHEMKKAADNNTQKVTKTPDRNRQQLKIYRQEFAEGEKISRILL